MKEFSILVCNMGHFLTRKKFAKEAEVEKVHIQENFDAPTLKHNNVQESIFKFSEKWKDGRPWL